jgi:hypothetical protein
MPGRTDWLEELPLSPGPPFLKMGVQPLDLATWLVPDAAHDTEMALRRQLVDERHEEVFAALEDTEDAGAETLSLLCATLRTPPPEPSSRHPLEAAGLLVQEDLCLMVPRGDELVLGAALLCFPSHWRLADKLGRPAAAIHGPVPRYDPDLMNKVDTFLDRLRPDRPVWRRNWNIHDHDALFAPVPPPPRVIRQERLGEELFVRSELQTLHRLPRTGAVLFTIKTQQAPLDEMAGRPGVCTRLAATIRELPDDHLWGRSFAPYRDQILAWLDAHAEND